jgi:hypothetical protein
MPSFFASPRIRARLYFVALLAVNFYFVRNLFLVDYTNNMQHNAGSFMAISRFILLHWPHLDWFPWWNDGLPFENTYTPMLHLIDAAFAWAASCSTARAFNFVTGAFSVTGPAFLFLFAWRVSRYLETSFFAALIYSLFSSSVMFSVFRSDVGSIWSPWRLRTLIYYGEGPHATTLSVLPLVLLSIYFAILTRRFLWTIAAAFGMAFVVLVNAFGAVNLTVGCVCLILALPYKEIPRAAQWTGATTVVAYLWASPYLTPTLIRIIAVDSQSIGGDFSSSALLPTRCLILAGFVGAWLATRWIPDYFTRFSVLFAFVFFAITAAYAVWNRAAMPQPHRYSTEMDLALPLAFAFALRPAVKRIPRAARSAGIVLIAILALHQIIHFRRYAIAITQKIDVTQTIEYRIAKAIDRNFGGLRTFVSAQAGTWLNVFSDTPQMFSGHEPFNPNTVEGMASHMISSGKDAGARDAEISILWLKAFGCHGIYVPGPHSSVYNIDPFPHPGKFDGVLPVLWHEEDDTIYAIPQRSESLAHVVPEAAIVKHQPAIGMDTDETARYVAALDDATLPLAGMTWRSSGEANIQAVLRPGQVLSVQVTYDKGWVAFANGRPAEVTRDGLGLTEIHAACDGGCVVDFIFDGGLERKVCRMLSWTVSAGVLLAGFVALGRRRRFLQPHTLK